MKNESSDFDLETSARSRRHHMMRRAAQLVLLAVAADLAVLFAEFASGLDPYVGLRRRPLLYLYLFLGTIVAFGAFGALLGSREALLKDMALRDSLTGLLNSRYLHTRLQEELVSAKRHEKPTSLVLFDVDHFKKVNDEYGHPVGDQMLQLIGKTIRSTLRQGEIAARVGGEEFALLLPRTSAGRAAVSAERIRNAIGLASRAGNGQRLAVTVSAGVACTSDHGTLCAATLYRLADQALYQAKKQGRDRVVVVGASNDRRPTRPDNGVVNADMGLVQEPA